MFEVVLMLIMHWNGRGQQGAATLLQMANVLKEVNSEYVMELKMRVAVLEETELWTWRSREAKRFCFSVNACDMAV